MSKQTGMTHKEITRKKLIGKVSGDTTKFKSDFQG